MVSAPTGWTIKGTADFNHDGTLDALVTNGTANQIWFLNNGVVGSSSATTYWSADYTLLGLLDYDHDGNADLLFRQISNGSYEVDYLNQSTYMSFNWTHPTGVTADPIVPLPSLNEGTDTVQSSISYALPTGVENLRLTGAGNINATGNSLDNIITGNDNNNILTGGAGSDTFVFKPNFGRDTIADFQPGQDIFQFDHTIFTTVSDVLSRAVDDGHGNVIVTADVNNTVTIQNVTSTQLQQHLSDFHIV